MIPLEDERNTIIAWKQGNKKAYEALVEHYKTEAYLVAYGLVGNVEDARDLSQDAFIKAYLARERFDADRPFFPWLYRIIRNHCLNFLKRGSRYMGSLYFDESPDRERFASPSPTPLEKLESRERRNMVRHAIEHLSDDHREIIMLKNFRGLPYKEISEVLEVPIGTVMSRLYYARNALREIIERLEVDGLPKASSLIPGPAAGEVV